jgi:hypothetical protein
MWRKRNPYTQLEGMQISTIILENTMKGPQKTEIRTAIKFSNPSAGYVPKGKVTCTPVVIAAPFTKARMCNRSEYLSTNKWIRKCNLFTHWSTTEPQVHEILVSATTWMELEIRC